MRHSVRAEQAIFMRGLGDAPRHKRQHLPMWLRRHVLWVLPLLCGCALTVWSWAYSFPLTVSVCFIWNFLLDPICRKAVAYERERRS